MRATFNLLSLSPHLILAKLSNKTRATPGAISATFPSRGNLCIEGCISLICLRSNGTEYYRWYIT